MNKTGKELTLIIFGTTENKTLDLTYTVQNKMTLTLIAYSQQYIALEAIDNNIEVQERTIKVSASTYIMPSQNIDPCFTLGETISVSSTKAISTSYNIPNIKFTLTQNCTFNVRGVDHPTPTSVGSFDFDNSEYELLFSVETFTIVKNVPIHANKVTVKDMASYCSLSTFENTISQLTLIDTVSSLTLYSDQFHIPNLEIELTSPQSDVTYTQY